MPQVTWSPAALDDLARLHDFLDAIDSAAARNAIIRVRAAIDRLQTFPELSPEDSDEPRYRKLIVGFGSGAYVIRYRLDAEQNIAITRVWHSREHRS